MDPIFRTDSTAMLVSSWFNFLLYAAEINLSVYYFMKTKPRRFYKWSLILALAFDTSCTAVSCYNVYLYMIIFGGVPPLRPIWPAGTSIILTFATSTICQVFFLHRFYTVSKNRIVAAILAIFIVFHESIGTIAAIWQIVDTSIPGSDFRVTGVIIAGASSAAADIIIAVVLFISLWRISTAYTRTKNTFKRISIHAAACGLISATATVVDLVLLFKNYTGFLVIFTILGRLYTLTLLANLLLLKRLAKNETTIYTTDPTLRQNTMTVDRATESIAFSTRISGDANGTCDRSFTIPIELSMQYSITEEGHSTQASQTSNFDHHIKPCSSPVAPKPNIELTVSQITHEV